MIKNHEEVLGIIRQIKNCEELIEIYKEMTRKLRLSRLLARGLHVLVSRALDSCELPGGPREEAIIIVAFSLTNMALLAHAVLAY